eukprot:m.96832 g.96832  ORF g.96832 m.96832 type:complete len:1141 (-) comp26930_c0_seq2:242-3664(-)
MMDSNSQDETEFEDASHDPVRYSCEQPLGSVHIHEIATHRPTFKNLTTTTDVVKSIVKTLNKSPGSSDPNPEDSKYTLLELNDSLGLIGGFEIAIVSVTQNITSNIAKFVKAVTDNDANSNPPQKSFAIFFHRGINDKKEMFALASDSAHLIVKRFADYDFPIKLARRCFDARSVSSQELKCLVGPNARNTTIFRADCESDFCTNELDSLWHIIDEFKTTVKAGSSIASLKPFRSLLARKGKAKSKGTEDDTSRDNTSNVHLDGDTTSTQTPNTNTRHLSSTQSSSSASNTTSSLSNTATSTNAVNATDDSALGTENSTNSNPVNSGENTNPTVVADSTNTNANNPPQTTKKMVVNVGRGKVVFTFPSGTSFSINDYAVILPLFGKISRGEETTDYKSNPETDDTVGYQYLSNLSRIDSALERDLDGELIDAIYRQHWKDESLFLVLTIAHQHYKDLEKGCTVTVLDKAGTRVRSETFHKVPSALELIKLLKDLSIDNTPIINSEADLKLWLGRMCVKFSGNKVPCLKFFDCAYRRSHVDEKNETVFRSDSKWYRASENHQSILAKTFFAVLKNTLLVESQTGFLELPWITTDEDAGFVVGDVDASALTHQGEFTFVSSKNTVLMPYPLYCILKNISKTHTPVVKKNWEEIRQILEEKRKNKGVLVATDFKFGNDKTSEELLDALKKDYTRCLKLKTTKATHAPSQPTFVLAKDGTVNDHWTNGSFDHVTFTKTPGKTFSWLQNAISEYLTENRREGSKVTQKRFCEKFYNHTTEKGHSVKSHLRGIYVHFVNTPISIATKSETDILHPYMYVMYGNPTPNGHLRAGSPLFEQCRKSHELYKVRCEEEGYNRQYLEHDHYIVCDQIFASKREKVEVFDVLYDCKKDENLYLYHIKKGFSHKTGEACNQIRNACDCLNRDRHQDYPMLRSLFRSGVADADARWKKKLKKKLENYGEKGFIDLFKRDPKKIFFVYAFVTSTAEKRIESERNPSRVFGERDFLSTQSSSQQAQRIFKVLQELGYLDTGSIMTDKFVLATKSAFESELKGKHISAKNATRAYEVLFENVSQFDSILAKMQIIHCAHHVKNTGYGFGFKMCQIRRRPSDNNTPETNVTNPPTPTPVPEANVSEDKKGKRKASPKK